MKKILLIALVGLTLLNPMQKMQAQNSGAGVAAGIGAILAVGATIAAIEQLKEDFELKATQEFLSISDSNDFTLKIADLGGTKAKDISDVSIFSFKVTDRTNNKRLVLMALLSSGWRNQYGVDYSKINWRVFEKAEWADMISSYVKVASGKSTTPEDIMNLKIVNKGVKAGSKTVISFKNLKGDDYLVGNYSEEFKLVYNEKSLGLYLKETKDLVQIRRGTVIKLHEFLAN